MEQVPDVEMIEVVAASPPERRQRIVALIELKHANMQTLQSQRFSQLMHAAAMAFNSN